MPMPAARRRSAGEGGLTLIEVLVTVSILGLSFLAIVGGMTVSIAGSDVHRKQATSQTILRNFAEYLKSDQVPYAQACSPDYSAALAQFTAEFTDPEAYAVRIVEVGYGRYSAVTDDPDDPGGEAKVASATFDPVCVRGDSGLQRLTIEVESLVRTELPPERLDVVKRRAP